MNIETREASANKSLFYSYTRKSNLALYIRLEMGKHTKKPQCTDSLWNILFLSLSTPFILHIFTNILFFPENQTNLIVCSFCTHKVDAGSGATHNTKRMIKSSLIRNQHLELLSSRRMQEDKYLLQGVKKKNVGDPQKTGSEFQLRPGKRILGY